MSIAALKTWIQARLSEVESTIGEPSRHNAAIVAELKQRCYEAGLYELSLSLPIVQTKHGVSAAAQLHRMLGEIDSPAAVEGDYLTPPQVARILHTTPERVIRWIRDGSLTTTNMSRGQRPRYRITRANLASYLERGPERPQPRTRRRGATASYQRDFT